MLKKLWSCVLCGVFLAALLSGCGIEETKEEAERETSGEVSGAEKKEKMYRFVDVYGEEYEAELLTGVPECTYDYDRLSEKDGYKCYKDTEGNISSRTGIDVSKYQPEIDWNLVRDSGIEFVMVRLGYRGYGEEGRLVEDECFRSHVEGALKAGLPVGVYFFSQAVDKEETLEEVQFVLERIKDYDITYPVVFDTEEIKNDTARTDNLPGKQFTENCITFCDTIEEAGYDSMIYANMKWLAFTLDIEALKDYDIWYADYEELPQNPYAFAMWQYTEEGEVPGIPGNVDINLLFEY